MKDYKSTLNLPETEFPMRANLPQREPEMLQRWHALNLYEKLGSQRASAKKFILHDGPPYANARPHLGTALNKILKDTVVKAKGLSGYYAPYVPGWDCHGLPIELNVEKKTGKPSDKLTPKAFREACRAYALSQVKLQSEDFQRLGIIGDWKNPYLTMDYVYEANTVRALAKIIANGHLHRGQKPVHWCIACGSALAEAEVEYRDKSSPAIDVGFEAEDAKTIFKLFDLGEAQGRVIVPIWTTTPWTLPANQAVTVHPELIYTLVQCEWRGQPTYFVLAKDLVDEVTQRYGIENYSVHGGVQGQALEKINVKHPFLDRTVPIILGEHVTTEAGTGNVHTAPAHGLDDYLVAEKYDLPIDNPVDSRGCFSAETLWVGCIPVLSAYVTLITLLADNAHLLHSATVQHSYPHCWRHKTPLIFRATPQWFISMDQKNLRKMAIDSIAKSTWIPAWGEARIRNMIQDRPDWCVSRQRAWGIPIPLFVHKETQKIHPRSVELMEKVAQLIEKESVDAWFDLDSKSLLGADADHYDKVMDVLDVWFDSGVTHYCVLEKRPELSMPADLYLEGSDQHRGWFQSSLLTALAIDGKAPFKSVLTHGYVVDGEGRKMSKSLGNVILPADVVKNMGADVLRLWAASMDHTVEIGASDEILKRAADAYRRIRNTARFFLSNLFDFDPKKDSVSADQLLALDRWAIVAAMDLQKKIQDAYDHYRFPTIYQAIHNFCTVEMGSFYLDIIKDRLYTSKKDGVPRRSAQTALYVIVEAFVRWIAPILSFTADEIWHYLPGKTEESVFLTEWFKAFPSVSLSETERNQWSLLLRIRGGVNKVLEEFRNAGKIGSALEANVSVYVDEKMYPALSGLASELRFVLITSEAVVAPMNKKSKDAIDLDVPGVAVAVSVSEHPKCMRCWQRQPDVGQDSEHPDICERCVSNAFGRGEDRRFA